MWQAIAELVKQGMKNIASSGKNAQVNSSVSDGNSELSSNGIEKIDSKMNQTETPSTSTTEVKTDEIESNTEDTSSNVMGGTSVLSDKTQKTSKDVSTNTKDDSKSNEDEAYFKKAVSKFGKGARDAGSTAQIQNSGFTFNPIQSTVVSDERLKDIFGEETPIDCFAKIHSYEFKYTPEAQEMMQGQNHVDDKEHLGVMAQELLINPATSACVIKDEDGFLKVDTAQLTMANTATIAELSRKVQKLEEMLGER